MFVFLFCVLVGVLVVGTFLVCCDCVGVLVLFCTVGVCVLV